MKDILTDPILRAVAVFFSQIIFIYLRTINVKQVASGKVLGSIISGNGIAIAWLFTTAIGVTSLINLEYLTIVANLIGGSVGTYIGMKQKRYKVL